MRAARNIQGFHEVNIGPRPRTQLGTNCPIHEELFSSIQYKSEIAGVGIAYFKSLGHTNPKNSFLQFRAFIRQARTFYDAARSLQYRAGVLMYYYSFLNLAKAYISLSDPDFFSNPVVHGLKHPFKSGKLSTQSVYVDRRFGVFQKLYKTTTNIKIPFQTKLDVVPLLGYCSDISHEYRTAGYGEPRRALVKSRSMTNNKDKTAWPAIAVENFEVLSPYKQALTDFHNYFEQVEPNKHAFTQCFNLHAWELPYYSFFESKTTYSFIGSDMIPMPQMTQDVYNAIKNLFMSNPYDDGFNFVLTTPLKKNLQIPFNEPLAIYVVMFYLGSLVRYHPDYLEKLLDSKDAWILERFSNSSTITFLRHLSNLILGHDYIYTVR